MRKAIQLFAGVAVRKTGAESHESSLPPRRHEGPKTAELPKLRLPRFTTSLGEREMYTARGFFVHLTGFLLASITTTVLGVGAEDVPPIGFAEGTGTNFSVLSPDDHSLITLEVSEEVTLHLSASEEEVVLLTDASTGIKTFTVSGLPNQSAYHLYRDNFHNHELVLTDGNGQLALELDTTLPRAIFVQSQPGTVFLDDNATGGDCSALGIGTWNEATKTCNLIADVFGTIQFDSTNLTLDCQGHELIGPASPGVFGTGLFVPIFSPINDITVRDCDVSDYFRGFLAVGTGGHNLESNVFHDNFFGLHFFNSTNNSVSGNSLRFNNVGILTNGAHGSEFSVNSIEENNVGMNLVFSDDVYITSNTFVRNRNDRAVRIRGGIDNLVANNSFTDNGFGITLIFGGSHEIRDNVFIGNGFPNMFPAGNGPTVALSGENSNDNALTNNVMIGNAYGFGLQGTGNSVDTSNTVDGYPIYWFNDLVGETITPAIAPGAAGVYCDRCSGVTIRGFDLTTPMGVAIGLYGTTASSVEDNVIQDSEFGVFLPLGSDDNAVLDNEISLGFEDVFAYGIRLNGADGNTIAGNMIDLGPGNSGWHGISLGRHFPEQGGNLDPADWNTVADNSVTRVLQQAIEVAGSHNLIERNTMIDTGGGIVVGGVRVDKVKNAIRENVIRDGRDAWFPFSSSPSTFGHGINVSDALDTLVARNIVIGMRDNGLTIAGSFGTTVTRNDIYDNARTGLDNDGSPIFEVTSLNGSGENPAAIELSVHGTGNYWGRNCGLGNENGTPLFQGGVDSNAANVIDSYPFRHPVATIPINQPLNALPCPTGEP